MKKLLIISSFVLFCSTQTFAQITEGSYIIGGTSSFSLATNPVENNVSLITFSLRPDFGKFVSEKWLIGGGLGYSISQNRNGSGLGFTQTRNQSVNGSFNATRFYPIVDKLYFTTEYSLGANYAFMKSKFGSDPTTISSSSIIPTVGVSPGLAYFINPKWMLYARMGSLSYSYFYNLTTEHGSHNLGYNFQANSFGLGARYVLGTGK